jgi:hypothetical protein
MTQECIKIILEKFKQGNISEEETIILIEELYNKNNVIYPVTYPWPQITYDSEPNFKKYEVTCKVK